MDLLVEARAECGLPVITEVVDTRDVELVAEKADVLQVGARNMQNFALLEAVGHVRRPVMLKRGLSATIQEFLMAAEYIVAKGNYQVILCERGIRTFETMTRNTLDHGVMVEVHPDPAHALSDGPQSLTPARFETLMDSVRAIATVVGMKMSSHRRPDEPAIDR